MDKRSATMIKFKTERQEKEWSDLQKKNELLVSIVKCYAIMLAEIFGKKTTITDIYRSDTEHTQMIERLNKPYYPTVHSAWRGVDIRYNLMQKQRDMMEIIIHQRYIYDPERPEKRVLIYHDIGLKMHAHLQTHPNTEEKHV